MREILKNIACLVVAALSAYYLAVPAQDFYCANISACSGGFFGFDLGVLIWMLVIYSFFTVAFLTMFGGRYKYWWMGVAVAPVIAFHFTVDMYHVFLIIVWTLIAWGLGTLAHKTLQKLAPAFMAKID